MSKKITVKGIGTSSAKPDYVVLSMSFESSNKEYDKAMDKASVHIKNLTENLTTIGFDKSIIKTTNFNVRTNYESVKDSKGDYKRVFRGYGVVHDLKISFDFDVRKLSQTLASISNCLSHPQIFIRFTVKDATQINEEVLRSAAINAKRKAEILCEASGATIGELVEINYNWGELDIYSHSNYECCQESMPNMYRAKLIDIEPEDIDVSDTVTFVWKIN